MTRRGEPRKHHARLVAAVVLVVGIGGAGFGRYGPVPWMSEHRASPATVTLLAEGPRQDAGSEVAAVQGGLPTRLVASSAGIDAPISEVGVVMDNGKPTWETAWRSVGHHIDSARPGQPGNVVLTGHVSVSDSRNLAAFKTLDRLATGDVVELYAGDQVYRYRITSVAVVPSDEVRVLRSDHTARVTLITCTRDLKSRLVVVGMLV